MSIMIIISKVQHVAVGPDIVLTGSHSYKETWKTNPQDSLVSQFPQSQSPWMELQWAVGVHKYTSAG